MEIRNIEGLSGQQIREMVSQGGKFVMYKNCISIIVMTFNNPTDAYFIAPGKSGVTPGIGYLFSNLLLGWWSIPWGPIYTIGNIATILKGGKNITDEILNHINQNDPDYGSGTSYNIPGQNASSYENNTYNIPNSNSNNNSESGNVYNIPRN